MADYRELYYLLFQGISDAIAVLQKAQIQAEELYINSPEPILWEEIHAPEEK